MKRMLFIILSAAALLLPSRVLALDLDQINTFSSDITINRDASISIKETVEYETSLQKHGIYRYIPIRYNKDGVSFSAGVKNVRVTDETGDEVPYEKTTSNRNVTLKIGDPDTTFTGKKTYLISYHVEYALQEFENHDELYWDITGEGWQIPVIESRATIHTNVASIQNVICYSGPIGENDGKCTSSYQANEAQFSYPQTINYGDNFTVAVAFAKPNQIQFPTEQEKMIKRIADNALIAIPFIPMLFMFGLWYKKGRDWVFVSPNVFNLDPEQPKKLRPLFGGLNIPFVYEPFKDLTPGEAGLLLDERVDNQDVVAEIIDLARKKYLNITAIEQKVLVWKQKDYTFTKLKNDLKDLPEHQRFLMEKIFATGDEVLLSDLKGSFYGHIARAKTLIESSLFNKKCFSGTPSNDRVLYIVITVGLSLLVVFLASIASQQLLTQVPFIALVTIPIMTFIAINMVQKTAVGTALSLQAKGLKETIKRGAWREKVMEKNLFFEEMLPFAIALGVVKQLARDMEKLNVQPPQYFSDPVIRSIGFNSFINSFSTQATSSLSYNPSSSSYGGGSGFSGGSSGGGGGGGGGGSW